MASKNIKGLTVEIGGDTTKLGKALEDVNNKSRDLSSELGQINKLLRMDPGSADLLAQKQKVLAEAVQNTKKELETLKEAEKQVQKQFEKGEVSEAQMRDLQREIIATTKKLEGYEKAAKETADQVEELGDGGKKAKKGAKEVEDGADDAADALDDYADSAEKAEKATEGFGSKVGGFVKGGLQALTAGVTAAVGALVASAEATREYRTEMGKLDVAFTNNGHSSEAAKNTYKELQGVLGETEQAVEAANHLAKLTDNEEELQKWTDICTGVYATFGASLPIEGLTEAANETAKTGALTGALADALNWAGVSEDEFQASLDACTTEQERQALITKTLNGLYSEAADAYRETNAEIIRANQANEEWMSSMAEIGAEIEPILTDVKLLGASLLSDLVPGVKSVAEAFRGMLNGDEGSAEALGAALSGIFTQLLQKIIDMAPMVVQAATSLVVTLTQSLLEQLPAVTRTVMQIAEQLVNSLTTALPSLLTSLVDSVFGVLTNFMVYVPDVQAAIFQFISTLAGSIPDLVAQIASWIPALIDGILTAIQTGVPLLLTAAVQLLMAIVQAIPPLIEKLAEQVPIIVSSIITILVQNIPVLIQGALALFNAIVQAIPLLLPPLLEALPQIIDAILSGLLAGLPLLLEGATSLLFALIDAIDVILPVLTEALPQIIDVIITGLTEALPLLLDAAIQLLFAIIDAIPLILPPLLEALPLIIDALLTGLLDALPLLLDAAITLLFALIDAIPVIVKSLSSALPQIISTILRTLSSAVPKLFQGAKTLLGKIIDAAGDLIRKLPSKMGEVITAMVSGLTKGLSKIATVGSDLIKGLWNGIKDMTSWITGKLEGFGKSVLDGIKGFFGIKSPSRVFRDQIGKMLAIGMAEGIEDNADAPLDAMTDLSEDVLNAADEVDGLTLERRLNNTFGAPEDAAGEAGLFDVLGSILQAIKEGQILVLDGDRVVGGTLNRMNRGLGELQALATRGA